ncbi:hypothetical protein J6590_024889 [Homalodisca vitripennis]|nr:hypothetical protein J6590_024889 [Homalodisca vitripennis]
MTVLSSTAQGLVNGRTETLRMGYLQQGMSGQTQKWLAPETETPASLKLSMW